MVKVPFFLAAVAVSVYATLGEFDECTPAVKDVCGEGLVCVKLDDFNPSDTMCLSGFCVDGTLPRTTDHTQLSITQTIAPTTTVVTVTPTVTITATCSCLPTTTTITTTIIPTQTP
ncbi:hypothetical protein EXIGLDRAFT_726752 [Exidia glandulosa HHB12029]|uniref:Extracellular membrane protein CFEM domain-containing protein n=1 Tax=Exidia glandulosa HHB12029 TaxID=1314781 RepID=A0A165M747_EXIGL|nr:hypothetical protein EXIGLDRAFT_726752 [Exidia glandulosa HHB12029]